MPRPRSQHRGWSGTSLSPNWEVLDFPAPLMLLVNAVQILQTFGCAIVALALWGHVVAVEILESLHTNATLRPPTIRVPIARHHEHSHQEFSTFEGTEPENPGIIRGRVYVMMADPGKFEVNGAPMGSAISFPALPFPIARPLDHDHEESAAFAGMESDRAGEIGLTTL